MSSFDFLQPHPALRRQAQLAADDAEDDPNAALYRIRRFAELLVERLAQEEGLPKHLNTTFKRLEALREAGQLPAPHLDVLDRCRQHGNQAVHDDLDEPALVRQLLPQVHAVAAWYVERHGGQPPGPYLPAAEGAPLGADEQERRLRERLKEEAQVRLDGFASRERLPPREVEDLFIPPRFKEEPGTWEGLVEQLRAGGRFVVAGTAGGGKSMLSGAAVATLAADVQGPVPLYLPLATLDEPLRPALVRRARRHLYVRLDGEVLEGWLRDGRAVLILDGLDEARDPAEVDRTLEALAQEHPQLGVLVTSRPRAAEGRRLRGFTRLELEGWTVQEAAWSLSRLLDGPTAAKIIEPLLRHHRMYSLLARPLFVTLLALVYRERGELPDRPGELMDAAIRTLLETWPERRGRSFNELSLVDQQMHLKGLARASVAVDFDHSFASYQRALGLGEQGERWLEHLIDEVGLLRLVGQDRYQFLHELLRDRLVLLELRARGVDEVDYFIEMLGGECSEEMLTDLIRPRLRESGLALTLIEGLSDRPLPGPGAWYGASRAWWVQAFLLLMREGLVLDERASDALLRFMAADRLAIYRAMGRLEPMRIGDERGDLFGHMSGLGMFHHTFVSDPERVKDAEQVRLWLRHELESQRGERQRAAVAVALDALPEDELIAVLGPHVGEQLWMWPRNPAGRMARTTKARETNEQWVGEDLARAAGQHATLKQGLAWLEGASDWYDRALCALVTHAGRGLIEALVVLTLRQTLSLGFTEAVALPKTGRTLFSGPSRFQHQLVPLLGVSASPGLGGRFERFRGLVWLTGKDTELSHLVHSSGLRTPPGLMPFQGERPWPDTEKLDALPLGDIPNDSELLVALAKAQGMLRPTMARVRAGTVVGLIEDSVPIQLWWDNSAPPMPPPGQPGSFDPRQTWLAELVAASVFTRGLDEVQRVCHLQQRLQCRAVSNLWPHIEALGLQHPDREAAELLMGAMIWAQRTLTGTWPVSPWVQDYFGGPAPRSRLARVIRALWRMSEPGVDRASWRAHRTQLRRHLRRLKDHPVAELLEDSLKQNR